MSVSLSRDAIKALHDPVATTLRQAVADLQAQDYDQAKAIALVAAHLVETISEVVLDLAVSVEHPSQSRTFDQLSDVNGSVSHFQSALVEGIAHATASLVKDGYSAADATVFSSARALDLIAGLLKDAGQ